MNCYLGLVQVRVDIVSKAGIVPGMVLSESDEAPGGERWTRI